MTRDGRFGPRRMPGTAALVGRVFVGARNEREMTVLDLLRQRGPMTAWEVADALNHQQQHTAHDYLNCLVAAGLAQRRYRQRQRPRVHEFVITDLGRRVF